MRRPLLIFVLSLGAIGGFAWGFHHMHRYHEYRHHAFEAHVADVCVQAAQRVLAEKH